MGVGLTLGQNGQWIDELLGPAAPYRGIAIALVVAAALFIGYKISAKMLSRYMSARAHKTENVENFLLLYRYIFMGAGFIFVLVSLSGHLAALGLSAAFVGMVLGWSLQAPVTGIAAWLMIILKRPFRIGDRIIIAGIIGDVIDINLTHIVLNQVGGTVGGEEKSGRGVLIPNATLFQQVIYNYTLESNYILDEVLVRLTFDSDFDLAERICIDAAREASKDIIAETKFEPSIRCEFFESGVLLRLRYQSKPSERQKLSTAITRTVLREFKSQFDKVQFCYPHSVVRYKSAWAEDEEMPPQPRRRDQDSPPPWAAPADRR